MGAISALSTSVGTIKRNSVLFAVALAVTVVNYALTGVTMVLPQPTAGIASLPLSALSMLVMPFFIGGLLSMAHEGLNGTTGLDTFIDGAKSNYVSLLGAMVLFAVMFSIIMFVVMIAVIIIAVAGVGASATGGGSGMASGGTLGATVLLGLFGILAILVPVFFLQFYMTAIVVSDLEIGAAFKQSAELVRQNLLSTLGYTGITLTVGLVAGVGASVISLAQQMYGPTSTMPMSEMEMTLPEIGVGMFVALLAASVILMTIIATFGSVYQVAFYVDRLDAQ